MKHCYLGIENINLNATQKKAFLNVLKELGMFSDVYPAIRQSSLEEVQKELILEALYKHGREVDIVRLVERIDKQQADYDNEEIDASLPDMTPLTVQEKTGLANLFEEHESEIHPERVSHWRIKPDGEAIVLEGLFKDENLTVDAIKKFLGNIFGIDWNTIEHNVSGVTFDTLETPIVTYSRGGINYIRFALFGGKDASREEAGKEVREYIKDWDEVVRIIDVIDAPEIL